MRPRHLHVGTDTQGREHYYQTAYRPGIKIKQKAVSMDANDAPVTQHVSLKPQVQQEEKVIVMPEGAQTVAKQISLGDKTIHRYVSFVEDEDCGWRDRHFERHDVEPFEKIGEIFAEATISHIEATHGETTS
jgi:hypothetical protein